jgi:hypothetical protein
MDCVIGRELSREMKLYMFSIRRLRPCDAPAVTHNSRIYLVSTASEKSSINNKRPGGCLKKIFESRPSHVLGKKENDDDDDDEEEEIFDTFLSAPPSSRRRRFDYYFFRKISFPCAI